MGRQRLVRAEGRPRHEEWVQTETDQGQTAGLHENSSRDRHVSVLLPLPPSAALAVPLPLLLRAPYPPASRAVAPLPCVSSTSQLSPVSNLRMTVSHELSYMNTQLELALARLQ